MGNLTFLSLFLNLMRAVANLVSCVRNPPFGAPLTRLFCCVCVVFFFLGGGGGGGGCVLFGMLKVTINSKQSINQSIKRLPNSAEIIRCKICI